MAINFKGDIEEIRNNFRNSSARFRADEPYSQSIVAAELNAHSQAYTAAMENIAQCQRTSCSGAFIGQASNNPALLGIANDFNRMFSVAAVAPTVSRER